MERLNSQLRSINQQLRRQARAGTTYAPGLTYVPPSVSGGSAVQAVQASAQADVTDDITVKRSVPVTGSMDSTDGDLPLSKEEIEISRQACSRLKRFVVFATFVHNSTEMADSTTCGAQPHILYSAWRSCVQLHDRAN